MVAVTIINNCVLQLTVSKIALDIGGVFDLNSSYDGTLMIKSGLISTFNLSSNGGSVQGIYLSVQLTGGVLETLHCQWPTSDKSIFVHVGLIDNRPSCIAQFPYIAGAHWLVPVQRSWYGQQIAAWMDSTQIMTSPGYTPSGNNLFALISTKTLADDADYGRELYLPAQINEGGENISKIMAQGGGVIRGVQMTPGVPTYRADLWAGVINK